MIKRDGLLHIPKWMRGKVLARDGYRCRYCGINACQLGPRLEMDHVVPIARFNGRTIKVNLVAACYRCNFSKRARLPGDCPALREILHEYRLTCLIEDYQVRRLLRMWALVLGVVGWPYMSPEFWFRSMLREGRPPGFIEELIERAAATAPGKEHYWEAFFLEYSRRLFDDICISFVA